VETKMSGLYKEHLVTLTALPYNITCHK